MLPRTPDRRAVALDRARYRVRESETELLAVVGAFRVVPERELLASPADIRSLVDQDLVETRAIAINNSPERVLVLTAEGRDLLEAYREPRQHSGEPGQRYYGGLVKPRELAHNAQLYRMFLTERDQLESEGARIARVVLDYELKSEYHIFVHDQEPAGVSADEARRAFAEAHDLPFHGGHIKLPDLRIEYELPDGDRLHRDLELATEHYSRSQLSGKQSAGFRVYRAAGARLAGGRKAGSAVFDPHHLYRVR